MKKELEDKLYNDFPFLYDRKLLWGFECHDGWFDLIYDLSSKIEPLIQEWIKENDNEEEHPTAVQVKQKFASLRFYMSSGTKEIYDLIDEAEKKSFTTCEDCGSSDGKVRGGGWITVLCDECNDKERIRKWSP